MPVRMLDPHGFRRMPWKNGGGETIEMLAHPEGADLATFDWRISMARVASDGPFSRFDGIDRTLSVLEGGRLVLDFGGTRTVLDPLAEPYPFAGDAGVTGFVPDGPILDLNVMTRRGRYSHRVLRIADGQTATAGPPRIIAFAHRGETWLDQDGTRFAIPEGHAVLVADGGLARLTAAPAGIAYLIEIISAGAA
jgi:environmental stress-induced protein Ves